ncbi:MAG: ThuA domain-containing protein [Akkermansiaceae bacterium]
MKTSFFALLLIATGLVSVAAPKKKAIDPLKYKDQIIEAVSTLETAKPQEPRKLLVFSLTNGFYHKSIPVGQLAFQIMAEKTGAFEAIISNDLSHFEPENINEFDAICFLNTTQELFSPHKKQLSKLSDKEKAEWQEREIRLKKSLMDFIKGGKGFVGIHAATDTFYKWPEYGVMIGAYFDGHPWGAQDLVSIRTEEGQEDQCCVFHLKEGGNLEFKEEIYQFKAPYDPKKLQVILRLDPEKNDLSKGARKDNDYPVSWIKQHGKGNVFYSSLGHNNEIYTNPKVLQHYLSGIQWALGDLTEKK